MSKQGDFLFKDFKEWSRAAEIVAVLSTASQSDDGDIYADPIIASDLANSIKILAKGYFDLVSNDKAVPDYRPVSGQSNREVVETILKRGEECDTAYANTDALLKKINGTDNGKETRDSDD